MSRRVEVEWIPKTKLGDLVQQGLITLDKIFSNNLIVKEKEIINILLFLSYCPETGSRWDKDLCSCLLQLYRQLLRFFQNDILHKL